MEHLQYVIEDSTLAEVLGVYNFNNDESAVLELVKNAYDAKAPWLILEFSGDRRLTVTDNGIGMSAEDIKTHWMHVGSSSKGYEVIDENNHKRILSGSKGVGRFAIARLGRNIKIFTKKKNSIGVVWITDWNESTLNEEISLTEEGTRIVIDCLREKWGKKKVEILIDFLSKTYNDSSMKITIIHPDISSEILEYFPNPRFGINCLSNIRIQYDSKKCILTTHVDSDEFVDAAKVYCPDTDIKHLHICTEMIDELKASKEWDLSIEELKDSLVKLGDFSSQFYFNVNSTAFEMEKFLYKYSSLPESLNCGIILYRNAFGISAYEGKKDWLGLGKRTRKSPAAASHPTGSWRVRENQLAGKVVIDKKQNQVLQELSNRQGLDENIYYQLFIETILTGIKEFERYRQNIIRNINVKNNVESVKETTPVSDKVVSDPKAVSQLSKSEAKQLAVEIGIYRKESSEFKKEKETVVERYRYDVRILNMLATTGLKASSIAHEMRNDRNSISENKENIILALQEYGMWEELQLPEKTEKTYKSVPYLLESNSKISEKIVTFMDTMLSEIEKKKFEASWLNIADILNNIKGVWERDYAWINVSVEMEKDISFIMSEDIIRVIFDNLILNSIQKNENRRHIAISITIKELDGLLLFVYRDDGEGLDKKYASNPRKILEVHETTRKKGHGLGMWIVNNTAVMSGGEIIQINGNPGFSIEFTIGGKK